MLVIFAKREICFSSSGAAVVVVESEALKVEVERLRGMARLPSADVAEDVFTCGVEDVEAVLELGIRLESKSSPAGDALGVVVEFCVVEVEELRTTAGSETWALTPEIAAKMSPTAIHKIGFLKGNTGSNSLIEKSRYYNKFLPTGPCSGLEG